MLYEVITLAGILRMDPDWGKLPKGLDPRARLLLERCLEKNVRNRYHGIADARVDIERMLRDPNSAAEPGAAYGTRTDCRQGPSQCPTVPPHPQPLTGLRAIGLP